MSRRRRRSRRRSTGAAPSRRLAILAYIALRHRSLSDIPPFLIAGLGFSLVWTFTRQPAVRRALVRLARRSGLARLCGYIALRYEALTYEIAMLPIEGIIGSAILIFLVLEASRRTSGWGFVGIILAMAVYIYISPYLPGDFQTRCVSPERLVVYLGLDINGMIGSILAGRGAGGDPVHDSRARCWRAPAAPTSSPILRCRRWAISAAARPRSRWSARRCSA